jgi:hypothetical protein
VWRFGIGSVWIVFVVSLDGGEGAFTYPGTIRKKNKILKLSRFFTGDIE